MTTEAVRASTAKQRLLEQRLRGRAASAPELPEIRRTTGSGPTGLSPVQHGMWLTNQLLTDNAVYGVHWTMWLRGDLDVAALTKAFTALVQRHDVLRSAYPEGEDGPVQVIGSVPADLLRVEAPTDRDGALALATDLARTPFDLAAGPLFGAVLVPVAGETTTHLLVVRAHHLLVDEWTGAIIARELGELYAGATLSTMDIQYADYAAWQAERVSGELGRRQLDHWRAALDGVAPVLELPTDRPRSADAHRGATVRATLSKGTSAAVQGLAAGAGTTVFSTLLTVFAGVLHRYTGQPRFAIGSLVAGRPVPQTEPLVGLFANTVAIPVDLSGTPTTAESLRRTNTAVLGALANADVPFDQVVADLRVERSAEHNPLFQVLFQAFEAGATPWRFAGLDVEPVPVDAGHAKADLTLFAVTRAEGIELILTYAEDLFDEATARRLLGHVGALTGRACAEPERPLAELDLLTEAERDRAVRVWNDTAARFPGDATVHGLFERCVRDQPEAVAVRCTDGTTLSYRELDARANQLAHHLRGMGVGCESMVAVCVGHSPEMFVALLGILKSGAAYVPLDAALPSQRLEWILTDTAAPIVVTTEALADAVPDAFDGTIVRVDTDWPLIADQPAHRPEPVSGAQNLLYVIYTSGSTGRPKGVLVPHVGVVNYLHWATTGYGLAGERGAPMLGSIAFDLSVPNFWLPLIGGKCVTLLPPDRSLETLAEVLAEPGDFSLLKITPGHLDVLRGMLDADSVHSVRTFVVGADEVRPETVAGWRKIAPGARVLNEYGPTETVVGCSVHEIEDEFDPSRSVSIGRPIDNLRMYVLDAAMNPAPVGVVGELFIGGIGVARGYLHRAALTAEKFVPDPFGAPGDRLYRTGDLARSRPNGELDFLGRTDFQVKVRGYRIELGEVEARLGLHPGVVDAVAAAVTGPSGHKRLVGYLVAADKANPPAPNELRAFMAEVLPDYMVPSVFVTLDEMPLTSAGKVDRTALPAPGTAAAQPADDAPGTPAEHTLAGIWRDVLGRSVGVRENFFEAGGDSVLAIRVAAKARRAGLALSVGMLFRHQTIAEQAKAAGTAVDAPSIADSPAEVPAELAELGAVHRLSPLQAGMVLHTVADPSSGDYLEQFVFAFEGDLDHDALARAWRTVVRRHAALRTSLHWRDLPYPMQVVHSDAVAALERHDWRDPHPERPEDRLDGLLRAERARGFAENHPPVRVHLVRVAEQSHRMVLVFHHALLDGWSMPIVVGELFDLYRGTAESELPEPVDSQRYLAWLAGRDRTQEAAFWRDALAGFAEATPIPVVRPAPEHSTRPAPREDHLVLSTQDSAALRELARRHRGTIGALMQGAWGLLLARRSGRRDVVFGSLVTGRFADVADLDRMVGMLMNTVPVRVRFPEGLSTADWIARLSAEQWALRPYEHSVLSDVQRHCAVPAGTPLFDSIVVFDNVPNTRLALPGAMLTGVEHDHGRSGHPLVLDVADRDALELSLFADPERVSEEDSAALLADYQALLARLAAGASLDELLAESAAPPIARESTVSAAAPVRRNAEAERVLTAIWADVLGVAQIGPHDDFVEWGGDSILAMQVVARAREAGLDLRPRHVFSHPTIAELAAVVAPAVRVKHAAPVGGEDVLPAMRARFGADAVADAYPLSPLQTGILVQSIGEDGAYVQVFGFRLAGAPDVASWERAWRLTVERHPALRTAFAWQGLAEPHQVVLRAATVPMTVLDWRDVAEADQDARLRELMLTAQRTGVDLSAGPPMHLTLVRTGADSSALIWRTHHIVLDGWSLTAVFREVYAVYESLRTTGSVPVLPDPTPQREHLAWLAGHDRDADARHWSTVLAGCTEATPLPGGEAPDVDQTGSGTVTVDADAELVAALHRATRRHRVTAGAFVHAAWGMVLGHHAGRDDVLFGSTVSGRSAPEIQDVVGMVMNTLPVRVTVDRTAPAGRWLRGLHDQLVDLREHEHCAMTDVRKQAPFTDSARRLFDTIVVFHNERYGAQDLPVGVAPINSPEALDTGYPLVLDAILRDGLQLQLNYQRDSYRPETARRLAQDCLTVLRGLTADDDPVTGTVLARLAPAAPRAAVAVSPVAVPSGFEPPRTSREQTLADIWAEVLGVAKVGVHDNLFELGGDSVLAIQIVARARQVGIPISARRMFDHPTIAGLGVDDLDTAAAVAVHAEQGPVTGPVALTPVQRWFTELDWPHDHYNQSALLAAEERLDADVLAKALTALVRHHDALRLRLVDDGGTWHQWLSDVDGSVPVTVVEDEFEAAATEAHRGMSLTDGPLLRAVVCGDRVLLAAHHVAVDTVSWGILIDDLSTAYQQVRAGRPVTLPAKTTSVQHWASRLTAYATSDDFAGEAAYWRSLDFSAAAALPVDQDGGAHTEGSTVELTTTLPADVVLDAPASVESLLLTAVGRTLAGWTGESTVVVDVERHGREPLFADVDLSRTVGWFTAVQPVLMTLGDDPTADLTTVGEQLSGVPDHGIGHGLATGTQAAQLVLNYHGRGSGGGQGFLRPVAGPVGVARAPEGVRPYLLEVDAAIAAGTLHVTWKYSTARHDEATVRKLADAMVEELALLAGSGKPAADPVVRRVFPAAPVLMVPAARRGIPGMSVAVVSDGELVREFAHGEGITPDTVFQAGSASKQVAALTVLRLVDAGVLDLDAPADEYLRDWRIGVPVTLRQLLTHTGGLTFHDYSGYRRDADLPPLREILTGSPRVGTPAVRSELTPGAEYRYSGSHYTVLQQLIGDVTGLSYADAARELVFEPLGLRASDYAPGPRAATGHRSTGVAYPGGWRVIPEHAAAGLWTTASDLARITLEMHRAAHGRSSLLTPALGEQIRTPGMTTGYGLGLFVFRLGGQTRIGHGGETPGYKALATFDWESENGMVIMTNSDAGREFLREVHAEMGATDLEIIHD
ncbi:non-ribosomal peptide synthetase [Labedaea rhizosphaerae]|uniref:Non-ribosomal peptide synthase protein (TIGR01720 family)/amino acid adenylation domain-containing protein n=1 Tax=Labedaea rhizosphaerae TaxID=598644 RepID=A0A4R6RT03_LABRH|nr:non-ribosomal peptide synthetase [Labedaea rhizosphaerae]TDP89884.1 non-ribosomal peptide synthase protein (TIGR01720 family)/amino acid adenylation domain-containing protein [Labedaea rhizosphaerae]